MPDVYGPFTAQTWTQAQWYRDAVTRQTSGVNQSGTTFGTGAYGAGDLALSVSGLTVTLALGRANVRGAGYERTGTAWSATLVTNTNANPRIDRIVLRRDLAAGTVTPAVLQGTPAATPAAPALTKVEDGIWELELFAVTVPGGSGTTLTNLTDERYSPVAQHRMQSGTVTIVPSAANTPTSVAVTFPQPFPYAPRVMITPNTTVPGTVVTGWSATGVTTTGFTAWVTRGSTASTDLFWFAHTS